MLPAWIRESPLVQGILGSWVVRWIIRIGLGILLLDLALTILDVYLMDDQTALTNAQALYAGENPYRELPRDQQDTLKEGKYTTSLASHHYPSSTYSEYQALLTLLIAVLTETIQFCS
jgi:hypothetical protein